MDYINTSHPNFIGGSKAVEVARQQTTSSRIPLTVSRQKVCCAISHVYFAIHEIINFLLFDFSFFFFIFWFLKDGAEPDKAPASERSLKSRAILARQANGVVSDQVCRIWLGKEKSMENLTFQSSGEQAQSFSSLKKLCKLYACTCHYILKLNKQVKIFRRLIYSFGLINFVFVISYGFTGCSACGRGWKSLFFR